MTFQETVLLMRLARAGDRAGLDQLLERYRAKLLMRIRLMMGERAREQAESVDFLQGLMTELVAAFDADRVPDEQHFLRWASEIARNNIRDAMRKRREEALTTLLARVPCDAAPSPSEHAAAAEDVHRLIEGLEGLDEDLRNVIVLRDLSGLAFREVARRMGRSENAVQLLHTRAMLRLGAWVRCRRAGKE